MNRSGVHEGPTRPTHRAGGPAFDLIVSKLRCPVVRRGTVPRWSLIDRLGRDDLRPIVSVVAPAGYGKTTLLAQWAERCGPAVAWVSVDAGDNDPKVLLSYVAQALHGVQPIGGRVFDALASPTSSVPGSVVPRLGAAFAAMTAPVALVLDDVHLLHNTECRAALSVLADHIPAGSLLALAGRDEPPLRVARLRAEGKITEIRVGDLALTRAEAAVLLRDAGVRLDDGDVAELHQRTEGWAVGLYLAALYLRDGGAPPGAAGSFGGGDRLVSDYVEAELLPRISERVRVFLTRTAVLDRMCGPLCDAVLERSGSAATLADLARSNQLLVPLDRRGHWYRYHRLFRDMLLAELERVEPDLIPVLGRRAAAWCLRYDLVEASLEYSLAAGDVDQAARLVGRLARLTYRQGRVNTLWRWCRWLDERGGIDRDPMAVVWAALVAAAIGRPVEAERWADAVDRWQYGAVARADDPPAEAWAALLRAVLCRGGVERMRADADEAARRFAAENIAVPAAAAEQGFARVLSGDLDGGDAYLEDAISTGDAGAADAVVHALCQRSLVAMTRGHWTQAQALASQAGIVLRRAWVEDSDATALVSAVQARVALHRGDVAAARRELVKAQRLRQFLTYAEPTVAVQARIELTRVHLALGDTAGASTLLREIEELLKRRPRLGTLVGEAQALRAQLGKQSSGDRCGASSLTAAELRLLPLLSTHLSFADLGAELFVSPNTVKTHAVSIYRKLGVSSRGGAVTRARELGLLEG
jgi:LuxR family maltose regulon positive regulatory protein